MGQVEDILEMTNEEASDHLRRLLTCFNMCRGNGKSLTILRTLHALCKAIDLLEKTPDESSKKRETDDYVKLCPKCDEKASHPSPVLNGESKRRYDHFCLGCGRAWNECDDE